MNSFAMNIYGITAEQLHQDALEMAPIYKPVEIRTMEEVMHEMMGDDFPVEIGDINHLKSVLKIVIHCFDVT